MFRRFSTLKLRKSCLRFSLSSNEEEKTFYLKKKSLRREKGERSRKSESVFAKLEFFPNERFFHAGFFSKGIFFIIKKITSILIKINMGKWQVAKIVKKKGFYRKSKFHPFPNFFFLKLFSLSPFFLR